LLGETVSVFGRKLKLDTVFNRSPRDNRILRDNATIPLKLDVEILARQDWPSEIEYVSKAFRLETMVEILRDVGLQNARPAITEGAAAVDELLPDISHLGEVKVRWNLFTVR